MSVVAPVQPAPALMPKRLCALLPSAFLISRWPQPDSWAAWATMNAAGMQLGGAGRVLVRANEVDLLLRERRVARSRCGTCSGRRRRRGRGIARSHLPLELPGDRVGQAAGQATHSRGVL